LENDIKKKEENEAESSGNEILVEYEKKYSFL